MPQYLVRARYLTQEPYAPFVVVALDAQSATKMVQRDWLVTESVSEYVPQEGQPAPPVLRLGPPMSDDRFDSDQGTAMTAASPDPLEPRALPPRWLTIVPGLWLVAFGLGLQGLATLATTVSLGVALLHFDPNAREAQSDFTGAVVVNLLSLVGTVLILIGRVRCLGCPEGDGRRLVGRSVALLVVANLAVLMAFLLVVRTMVPGGSIAEVAWMLAFLGLVVLGAVVAAEWAFLAFLAEAASQMRAGWFATEFSHMRTILVVLVLLGLIGGVGVGVALSPPPQENPFLILPIRPEVALARAISAGSVVTGSFLVLAYAVYVALVLRAISALHGAGEQAERPAARRVIPGAREVITGTNSERRTVEKIRPRDTTSESGEGR